MIGFIFNFVFGGWGVVGSWREGEVKFVAVWSTEMAPNRHHFKKVCHQTFKQSCERELQFSIQRAIPWPT